MRLLLLISFLGLLVINLLLVFNITRKAKKADSILLSGKVIYLTMFSIFYLVAPILFILSFKNPPYLDKNFNIAYFKLFLAISAFHISTLFGFLLTKKYSFKIKKTTYLKENNITNVFLFLSIFLVSLTGFYSFFGFNLISGITNFLLNFSNRIQYSIGKGYIHLMLVFSSVGFYSFLDRYLCLKKDNWLKFFALALGGLYIVVYLITGMRGRIVSLLVNGTVIYYTRKKIKSVKLILVLFLIIMISVISIGYIRTNWQNIILGRNLKTFSIPEYKKVLTYSGGVSNFLAVILNKSSEYQLYAGTTFLALFTNIIPRSIWHSKPFGSGPSISNIISPGVYNFGGSNSTGFNIGLIGESFINWGFFGFFLIGVSYGTLISLIDNTANNIFKKNNTDPKIMILILFWTGITTNVLIGEFMGSMSNLLMVLIPSWFLTYILSKHYNKNYSDIKSGGKKFE